MIIMMKKKVINTLNSLTYSHVYWSYKIDKHLQSTALVCDEVGEIGQGETVPEMKESHGVRGRDHSTLSNTQPCTVRTHQRDNHSRGPSSVTKNIALFIFVLINLIFIWYSFDIRRERCLRRRWFKNELRGLTLVSTSGSYEHHYEHTHTRLLTVSKTRTRGHCFNYHISSNVHNSL